MKQKRQQLGQGMTEYIVMVALFAIAGLGVYVCMNWVMREQATAVMLEVAGGDGTEMRDNARASAEVAAYLGEKEKNLSNYMLEH